MMMTLLQAAEGITHGAAKMMETDPHGWTLTIVSVSVVFGGLLVLYIIYSISGGIFSGRFKKAPKRASGTETVAQENDEEMAAALAVAMYLEDSGMHDSEPGIVTVTSGRSSWADKSLTFRRRPMK